MQPEAQQFLFDMRQAGAVIQDALAGQTLLVFRQNVVLRSAVERQFQILGEALFQLAKSHSDVAAQIPRYRDIINFRHILVHAYNRVNPDVVWALAETDLPALCRELDRLLQQPPGGV